MKKIISVMLCFVMLFSLVSVSAYAEENDELIITVANDLHYTEKSGDFTSEDFKHIVDAGQLYIESIVIIEELLKEVAANESEILLIPGDLMHIGNEKNFKAVAAMLNEFEATSGKSVYVVPGNHEFNYGGGTREQFVEAFNDFGYSEAIARDTLSASYVAELNDEYRLLAIDGTNPRVNKCGVDAERVAWIEQQAKQAQLDGKKMIAMNHFNMLNHFVMVDILHPGSIVDKDLGLAEIFAKYNVKYTFCGHTHDQDIASYTGSNGNTIYDIVTSTINVYPCPYRVVTFGDEEVKIETRTIDSLSADLSFMQSMITPYCYELLTTDFPEYAKQCMDIGIEKVFSQHLHSDPLKDLLGLDEETSPEMCALFDKLIPHFRELVFMPLYERDETESGKSMEAMADKLGMNLVECGADTFVEIAVKLYEAHIFGDENIGILDPLYNATTTSSTVIFNELLSTVTAEEYTMVLDFACELLGVEEYVGMFTKYVGNGISRLEGINYFVSSVLNVIVLQFTTDGAPGDNNVTLAGYGDGAVSEEPAKELSIWEQIIEFFKNAFEYILRILGF